MVVKREADAERGPYVRKLEDALAAATLTGLAHVDALLAPSAPAAPLGPAAHGRAGPLGADALRVRCAVVRHRDCRRFIARERLNGRDNLQQRGGRARGELCARSRRRLGPPCERAALVQRDERPHRQRAARLGRDGGYGRVVRGAGRRGGAPQAAPTAQPLALERARAESRRVAE